MLRYDCMYLRLQAVAYSCTVLAAAALQPWLFHQGMIDLQMEMYGLAGYTSCLLFP